MYETEFGLLFNDKYEIKNIEDINKNIYWFKILIIIRRLIQKLLNNIIDTALNFFKYLIIVFKIWGYYIIISFRTNVITVISNPGSIPGQAP